MSAPGEPLACLCLTGPTASGKTELALALAERFAVEIVSMDSALVYRGLDIGTAKPSAAVRAAVPHHLIDIVEPHERYSAGRFRDDATAAIGAIRARGRIPLVVGGTLLYLKVLTDGLAALPEGATRLRARLDAEAAVCGWSEMHRRLAAVDPEAAARIAPADRQRIQRALEVYELTGRPLSAHHGDPSAAAGVDVATLALVPGDREALHARIERRFDAMVERGFVAEVERLKRRGNLSPALPSIRSVGYRQIWRYLDGELDWPAARAAAIVATRRLAKRQLTWLKALGDAARLEPEAPGLAERAAAWLQAHAAGRFAGAMC